jgi:Histidine kinase-, DNA gyrase B-, and HSP90-like ATPase
MRFSVEARLLDHFGIAMYNTVPKAIAELCANAYDADATRVDIAYGPEEVTILDNGSGMSTSELKTNYLRLGRDRRFADDGSERLTASGRAAIGNKGIGKLAGFGVARTMTVRTFRDGTETTIVLDREDLEAASDLESFVFEASAREIANERHGTEVRLSGILEGIPSVEEDKLRAYLARHLPASVEWSIFVNGVECAPDDIPGSRTVISGEVEGFGRVNGYYIVANDRRGLTPGFSVRVRGRIVQEASLFGLNQQTHGYFNMVKIVGELNPDFIDSPNRPTSRRGQFVINTSRSGFNPEDPAVIALNEFAKEKLEAIASGLAAERSRDRKKKALQRNPEFESRLKGLGPEIYGRLDQTLESLIAKLSRNEDDNTVDEIVDIIIRYYESDTLRIILDTVRNAAPEEVERLSQLLARYGAAQVAEIASILSTQLEVIELLKQKVEERVLEKDIHEIIAKNIWLLRNDLQYWFDNRAFSTQLSERLAEQFKHAAGRRPDLVCFDDRGLQGEPGHPAQRLVVIEFKRPGIVIGTDEIVQVMLYKKVFRASLPNFEVQNIEVYIIGDSFDDAFDRSGLSDEYHVLSYSELLANAHHRYQDLYDSLAPDGIPK